MIRFIVECHNSVTDRRDCVTVLAELPELEGLLSRGGQSESGFESWRLLGVELQPLPGVAIPQSGARPVELVQEPGYEGAWLPMHIHPAPGMQVVGLHQGERQWIEALLIHENRWQNADGELIDTADYKCWTYVKLPENKG